MKKLFFFVVAFCICSISYSQNVFGFEFDIVTENNTTKTAVTKIYKNSPAEKAGLKAGDYLNFINDKSLVGTDLKLITKILTDAPVKDNELRYYRNGEVYSVIISKAPLSSFEFACKTGNCNNGDCEIETTYGYILKGKCTDGKINGKASIYNENNILLYQGDMVVNIKQGNGIEYYPKNKTRYEGFFANGMREGKGKFYLADNSFLEGNWINNKIEGEVAIYDTNHQLKEKQLYKNGKKVIETNPVSSNTEVAQNKPTQNINNNTPKEKVENKTTSINYIKEKKDPSIIKSILDNKLGTWKFDFFSDAFPNAIPKKQIPPFEKSEIKQFANIANLTPDAFKKVIQQCSYENWPSFYKNYKDINSIFKSAFRNLMIWNVASFKTDKDNGEYRSYGNYTIIFIEDKENKHAPKELLSDDGIGFFMCVDADLIQDFMNPSCNYKPFTLDKPNSGGGFGNWASKKEVYLLDMKSIENKYSNASYSLTDNELQTRLGLSDAEFKKIKDLCNAENRPDGLKTDQQIIDAQRNAIFADMKAYSLADLGRTHLIYIPKNENYQLPQNIQPKSSEGWFFCTSSYVNTQKPADSYIKSLKATTDASMQQYRSEQAAREEQMKKDATAKAEWSAKNKFKGVVIIQYENTMVENENAPDRFKYNVITIFCPTSRDVAEADYAALKTKYGNFYIGNGYKYYTMKFMKDMDETKAIEQIKGMTQTSQFAVNTNFSYTIPERQAQTYTNKPTKKELQDNVDAALKERDKVLEAIINDKPIQKTSSKSSDDWIEEDFELTDSQKSSFSNLTTKNKNDIPAGTKVLITGLWEKEDNYTNKTKYIGKTGTAAYNINEQNTGLYNCAIRFDGEEKPVVFYGVKLNVVK